MAVILSLVAAIATGWASPAGAATLTWDANGLGDGQPDGGGAWLDANQWWDGVNNPTWTSGDSAIFGNGGAGGAVTLAGPTAVGSLTMNPFSGTYTLGSAGQAITLNSGITVNSGAGATTIISPVILGGAQSWLNNSTSTLTVGTDAVDNGGNLLTIGGSGNTAISSVIGGAGGLTKTGAGVLTLSRVNTFAGQLTVENGTLAIGAINNASSNGTLGNSALSVILGSTGQTGTLQYTGATAGSDKPFTMAAGGTGAFQVDTAGTNLALSGAMDGGGAMTKTGAGSLSLSGTNTYAGGTTISNGTVQFANLVSMPASGAVAVNTGTTLAVNVGGPGEWTADTSGNGTIGGLLAGLGGQSGGTVSYSGNVTLGLDITGTQTYSGTIGNVGSSLSLTKSGAGTLVLSGDNDYSYTGATTVNAGTLVVNSLSSNGFKSTNITINNGGTLRLGASDKVVDGATITVNTGGTLDMNGFGETIAKLLGSGNVTSTATASTLILKNGGSYTFSGVISGAGLSLTYYNATATLTLTGQSTYGGSTRVGLGGVYSDTLKLGVDNALPSGRPVTVDGSGSCVLDLNGYNQTIGLLSLGSNNGGSRAKVTGSGSSTLTLTDGVYCNSHNGGNGGIYVTTVDLNGSTQTFTVDNGNNTVDLEVTSVIQNGGLVVNCTNASAVLGLSGANTYSGATTVNVGKLQLDNTLALQNSPLDTSGTGFLTLNAGTGAYTIGGLTGSKNLSSVITSGLANMTTLKLNPQSGKSNAYSGVIANGAMAVTKTGDGTQTLAGANTYTGATTVTAGALVISGSPTGNSAMAVNGGTLTLDYGTNNTSKIHDSAVLSLGGGTVELAGDGVGDPAETVASTTLNAGSSSVIRSSGGAVLRMNAISFGGGVVNFGAANIASTSTANTNGILGAWATVGGTDWATNSGTDDGGAVGNSLITAYAGGYTDIDARGPSTILNGSTTNVRIAGDGTSGNIDLELADTTVNTILQNNADHAATVDTAGKTLRTGGIMIAGGKEAVTIGVTGGDGALTAATNGGALYLVNNNAAKTLTVNAVIADNSSASALTTAGNVLLAGVNTHTGATYVGGGTLKLNNQNAVQNSTLTMGGGGIVFDSSVTGKAFTFGGLASPAAGAGYDIALENNDATPAAVALTVGGNGANTTYAGALSGAGSLTKVGAGTLTLSGDSTFTGQLTVQSGTLKTATVNDVNAAGPLGNSALPVILGNAGAQTGALEYAGATASSTKPFTMATGGAGVFQVDNSAAALTLTGAIDGGGDLTKTGLGTLALAGANGGFSGNTTVSAGTLNAYTAAALPGYSTSGKVIVNGGTLAVQVGGAGWTTAQVDTLLSNATETGGSLGIDTTNGNLTQWTAFTPTNLGPLGLTKLGGNTLILDKANTYTGPTIVSAGTLQVGSAGTTGSLNPGSAITIYGNLTFSRSNTVTQGTDFSTAPVTGSGSLTKAGTGTLVLAAANGYTGVTTVTAGTLSVSSLASAGAASNIGAYPTGGAAGLVLGGGTLQYTGGTMASAIDRGFTLSATSTINVSTAGAAMKLGACSLGGYTLNVTGGAGSSLSLGATALSGNATLYPTTANLTVTSFSGAFNLVLGGTATGNSVTGAIATGAGTLTKNGNGTWTLSGSNSHTGGTTLTTGTLNVNNNHALGNSGMFTINGGAIDNTSGSAKANSIANTITLGGSFAFSTASGTAGNNLSLGTGAVTNAGDRTITLNGTGTTLTLGGTMTNTKVGVQLTTVNGAGNTLVLGGYALSNSAIGYVDTINGNGNVNITGAVTDGGTATNSGLTYSGTGRLTLSGTNTYRGATTVNSGTLLVNGNQSSATGSVAVKSGATLGGTGTIGGAITVEAGGILAPGASGGTLKDNASVRLMGNSIYNWEFDSPTAADKVVITGSLQLDTGWKLSLGGAGKPAANSEYDIFTYTTGFTGNIAGNIIFTPAGWPTAKIAQETGRIYLKFGQPGDTNGDFVVDPADYIAVKQNLGLKTGATLGQGNVDGDGDVDWNDLQIMMTNFGTGAGTTPATTPEPCSAMLLVLGAAALLRRNRRS